MNQKKETVPLHGYVGVTADVEWVKDEWDKKGESGRLTFHSTGNFQDKFPPLAFKLERLKGSTISLTRFTYFLNGKEKARFIDDLEEGRVVDANMVAFYADWCLEGKSQFPSTYEQMLRYKAATYIQKGPYARFAYRLAGTSTLVWKIAEWATHVLQTRGPRCEITGIYDYDTNEILEILGSNVTFTETMEEKGFPIHFPSLLNTPGYFMPHVSVESNAFAAAALGAETKDIAWLLAISEEQARAFSAPARRIWLYPRNESKLYPIGTIFMTARPMASDQVLLRYWQVVRCTKRTLWMQELQAAGDRQTGQYLPIRDTMKNDAIYECRINLKAAPGAPIRIDGDIATIWTGKVFTEDAHRTV